MKNSLLQQAKQRINKQQVTILALMLIPDSVAIALSTITAYNFRFPDSGTSTAPTIAEFDYKLILFLVALAWILILLITGTYKFNHATLVGLNLRLVAKRTLTFFFFLGFMSFILKASFFLFVNISGETLVHKSRYLEKKNFKTNFVK